MLEVSGAANCIPEAMLVACKAGPPLDAMVVGGKPVGTNAPEAGLRLFCELLEPSDRDCCSIIGPCKNRGCVPYAG